VYALHSRLSAPNCIVEPKVECPDSDVNDAAFIQVSATIRGCDAIEEFVACKVYPLVSSFDFRGLSIDTTPVSKIRTPLCRCFPC
jgi:hypothetical protein